MPNVLTVEGVSKTYEPFVKPAHRLLCALLGRRPAIDGFHALREVSFTVKRGEAFAVIGQNGAGKSTLLQIIVGTVFPTTGRVTRPHRVTNLLEIGSGFNQSYSGRENIFLNAALHGMSQKETLEHLDEIIAFADIGEFIDRPVNTYSAGMYLRLAFGIAVSIEPDLIVIDEALAVGDIFFQQKCFTRLRALKERGTAILLVTHSMGDAQQFCDRGLVLQHGHPVFIGPAQLAVHKYLALDQAGHAVEHQAPPVQQDESAEPQPASSPSTFEDVNSESCEEVPLDCWPAPSAFFDGSHCDQVTRTRGEVVSFAITNIANQPCLNFYQGDRVRIYIEFRTLCDIEVPYAGVMFSNREGIYVHGKSGLQLAHAQLPVRSVKAGSLVRIGHEVKLGLQLGEYTTTFGFGYLTGEIYERWHQIPFDQADAVCEVLCIAINKQVIRVLGRMSGIPSSVSHQGIADLEVAQFLQIRQESDQESSECPTITFGAPSR